MENRPSSLQEPPTPSANGASSLEPAKPQSLNEALKSATVDSKMFPYFGLWYFGNCYCEFLSTPLFPSLPSSCILHVIITSKLALNAAYGAAGFPVAIATLQLGFGCLYAFFLWATSGSKTLPNITGEDVFKMMPVGMEEGGDGKNLQAGDRLLLYLTCSSQVAFYAALAHSLFVYSIGAGAVSLSLLIRAAEPVFADFLAAATDKKKVGVEEWGAGGRRRGRRGEERRGGGAGRRGIL
eukprot:750244-Hanusia_phi.AAC.2